MKGGEQSSTIQRLFKACLFSNSYVASLRKNCCEVLQLSVPFFTTDRDYFTYVRTVLPSSVYVAFYLVLHSCYCMLANRPYYSNVRSTVVLHRDRRHSETLAEEDDTVE